MSALSPVRLFVIIVSYHFFIYCAAVILSIDKDFVNVDGVSYSAMPIYFDGFDLRVLWVYLSLMFVAFFAQGDKVVGGKVEFYGTLKFNYRYFGLLLVVLGAINLMCVFHFLSINLDVLSSNYEYQSIKTPEYISDNPGVFFIIFHNLFRILGLVLIPVFFYAIKNYLYLPAVMAFSVFLYAFFLLFIGESRWVLIYGVVFFSSVYYFFSLPRIYAILLSLLGFLLCMFLFAKVVYARNYGFYGIDYQCEIIIGVFSMDYYGILLGFLLNTGDGFINLANSYLISTEYGESYKILSFSPLPSFLDGFSVLLDQQARISTNVPYGSLSEAVAFGVWYYFIFCIILFLFLYSAQRVFHISEGWHVLVLLVIILWNVFYMMGYPLRNVMRVFLYMTIFNFIYFYAKNLTSYGSGGGCD